VSWYQNGKINLDREWQWHQLGHMQACTLLQTDNHTSTPPFIFLQAGCPSCPPTNSVKALKSMIVTKYAGFERMHIFKPFAVENLGTMNASAYGFLAGLGQKISAISGDNRETCYVFQRISVLIQHFNTTMLLC